jgi:hypothetical protein
MDVRLVDCALPPPDLRQRYLRRLSEPQVLILKSA